MTFASPGSIPGGATRATQPVRLARPLSFVGRSPRLVPQIVASSGETHMKKSANARFAIKSWDEKPYSDGNGLPRLTRASVTKTFTGDIEGEGQVEYLMMYRSDGSATFVGHERVVGRVGGQAGT